MYRMRKYLAFLSFLCLTLWLFGARCHAEEGYTYTVTFYPGNHGIFGGTGGVYVGSKNASGISVSMEGEAIKVRGLKSGDMVSLDAALSGAVVLEENSRYYVKGIRLSGRDNNTVDTSAFRVEGDRDYVVAYGIRGDMTSYVVNYQDEAGNALAESRTYYGNVGDKPVVAFLYVEGYEPMAYNLTKTLSSNEVENVFTFVYARAAVNGGGNELPGGNAPSDGDGGMDNAGTIGPGDGEAAGGAIPGADGVVDVSMEGNGNGVAAGDVLNAGDITVGNEMDGTTADAANAEMDDGEVPLDMMELDEEEVPLADNVLEDMLNREKGSRIFAASAVLVIVSLGVLIFFAFWMKRHSKKQG